jgi:Ceramidase
MDWSTPIDLYCERTDPSFWAEPANALSNTAFLVAAAAALLRWRRGNGQDWPALALIAVTIAVGAGSFIFHTVATRGARLADVIPIAIFIYGYLLLALRRFLGLSAGLSAVILVTYVGAAQALSWLAPPRAFNGSIDYLPALVALIAVALAARGDVRSKSVIAEFDTSISPSRPRPTWVGLGWAAVIFAVSLALRTIDIAACDAFPLGTHFIWHLLNATLLYVLLRSAIERGPLRSGD